MFTFTNVMFHCLNVWVERRRTVKLHTAFQRYFLDWFRGSCQFEKASRKESNDTNIVKWERILGH